MSSTESSEASSPPSTLTGGSLPSSASPASSSSPTPTPTVPTIKTPRSPKPTLPALKTPSTATLPSELPRSPAPGMLDVIKKEDDLMTPITPPQAYTEFLKALSPAVSSPGTARSPSFSFSGKSTPSTQPSSAGSSCLSCTYDPHKTASAPIVPPSPYMRPPNSARTPTALRRLRIPQSPIGSPATDSPRSASTRSPFSCTDWHLDGKSRYFDPSRTGCHRPVSVRQVVTRTVTYTRTPLDPPPKGKRRKIE
ncbi:MAG: hypothetical protein LQ343_005836 [Gyalolechia ehrenbergii]|nr:MAG: hypothetical protein LQ343_005836 [Gyalolechia ehrenbergii]